MPRLRSDTDVLITAYPSCSDLPSMDPAILLPAASYEFATIQKVSGAGPPVPASDQLAAEEPLEIRVGYEADGQRQHRTLSVTMRTPGHDEELAAGFLLTEGIIHDKADLLGIIPCPDVQKAEEAGNVVRAELAAHVNVDFAAMERHFYTSSSCGVCGKTSIDAVRTASCPVLPADWPAPALRRWCTSCPSGCAPPRPASSKPAGSTLRRCFRPKASCCCCAKTWAATTPWTR